MIHGRAKISPHQTGCTLLPEPLLPRLTTVVRWEACSDEDPDELELHCSTQGRESEGFGRPAKALKTKAGHTVGRTLQEGVCQRCLRRVRQHGCD